jgi:hypothetical protein
MEDAVDTLDMKKQYAALLKPSAKQAQLVHVPRLPFLMIDGAGDPNGAPFQQAVAALYSAAYTLKFAVKTARAIDYPVMPLEALWWVEGAEFSFTERSGWRWTAMILLPDFLTAGDVASAVAAAGKKKPNPALARVHHAWFEEGDAAQIMHVGPYVDEPATIAALHAFAAAEGRRMHGKHHEIYLSDPARTAPERMKTILRQPVKLG